MTASDLDISTKRLNEMRSHMPRDDVAFAEILATHASVLLQHVRIGEARVALEEATGLHHAAGRIFDEARCLSMTATLSRFGGLLDEAQSRAQQAWSSSVRAAPLLFRRTPSSAKLRWRVAMVRPRRRLSQRHWMSAPAQAWARRHVVPCCASAPWRWSMPGNTRPPGANSKRHMTFSWRLAIAHPPCAP